MKYIKIHKQHKKHKHLICYAQQILATFVWCAFTVLHSWIAVFSMFFPVLVNIFMFAHFQNISMLLCVFPFQNMFQMHNKFFLRCFASLNFIVFRYVFAAAHNFHFMEEYKAGVEKDLFMLRRAFAESFAKFLVVQFLINCHCDPHPCLMKQSAFVCNLCEIVSTCRGWMGYQMISHTKWQ